jgi:hypothetical protein
MASTSGTSGASGTPSTSTPRRTQVVSASSQAPGKSWPANAGTHMWPAAQQERLVQELAKSAASSSLILKWLAGRGSSSGGWVLHKQQQIATAFHPELAVEHLRAQVISMRKMHGAVLERLSINARAPTKEWKHGASDHRVLRSEMDTQGCTWWTAWHNKLYVPSLQLDKFASDDSFSGSQVGASSDKEMTDALSFDEFLITHSKVAGASTSGREEGALLQKGAKEGTPITPSRSDRSDRSSRRIKTSPYIKASLQVSKKRIEQLEANVAALQQQAERAPLPHERELRQSEMEKVASEARASEAEKHDTQNDELKMTMEQLKIEFKTALELRDAQYEAKIQQRDAEIMAAVDRRDAEHQTALKQRDAELKTTLLQLEHGQQREQSSRDEADKLHEATRVLLDEFKAACEAHEQKLAALEQKHGDLDKAIGRCDSMEEQLLAEMKKLQLNDSTRRTLQQSVLSQQEKILLQQASLTDHGQQLSQRQHALEQQFGGLPAYIEQRLTAVQQQLQAQSASLQLAAESACDRLRVHLSGELNMQMENYVATAPSLVEMQDKAELAAQRMQGLEAIVQNTSGRLFNSIHRIDESVKLLDATLKAEPALCGREHGKKSIEERLEELGKFGVWLNTKSAAAEQRISHIDRTLHDTSVALKRHTHAIASSADAEQSNASDDLVERQRWLSTRQEEQYERCSSELQKLSQAAEEQQSTLSAHDSALSSIRALNDEHQTALARLRQLNEEQLTRIGLLAKQEAQLEAHLDAAEEKRLQCEKAHAAEILKLRAAQQQELDSALGKMSGVEQKAQRVEQELARACERIIGLLDGEKSGDEEQDEKDELEVEEGALEGREQGKSEWRSTRRYLTRRDHIISTQTRHL